MLTPALSKFAEAQDGGLQDLLLAIIHLPNFSRLYRVSFLGAIERFAPRAGARTAQSRAEHSLGVAELAVAVGQSEKLSAGEMRLSLVHALLHDIGHGPFSHSCEDFFRSKFGLDHHNFLVELIEDPQSDESKLLRNFGLWFDYRSFVRSPSKFPNVSNLFNGPINVDTIEGIIRASRFFGVITQIDRGSLAKAVTSRPPKLAELDLFWKLKESIYNDYILSEEQSRYDSLICEALFSVENEVTIKDFRLDDESFEERYHRAISHQLNLANAKRGNGETKKRKFKVNKFGKPRRTDHLDERYMEVKSKTL